MGLIRANKATNQIDDSEVFPIGCDTSKITLHPGWELVDTNSPWYIAFETKKIKADIKKEKLALELNAQTMNLSDKEMIKYLMDTLVSVKAVSQQLLMESFNV